MWFWYFCSVFNIASSSLLSSRLVNLVTRRQKYRVFTRPFKIESRLIFHRYDLRIRHCRSYSLSDKMHANRSRLFSKSWNMYIRFSDHSECRHTSLHQCYRATSQIWDRYANHDTKSRDINTYNGTKYWRDTYFVWWRSISKLVSDWICDIT